MSLLNLAKELQTRVATPELMDLETCDPRLLEKTIRQFALINKLFSGSQKLITRHLFPKMEKGRSKPYTLLDIGAGGGDIAVSIVKEARKRGIAITVTALDRDECALSVARETVRDWPEIRVCKGAAEDLPRFGTFDFIFCNHLLHHLTWDAIGTLVKHSEQQTNVAFLLNDLQRSFWAYVGYALFAKLFLAPSLALSDGKLSIRKGFIAQELEAMVNDVLPGTPVAVIRTSPARLAVYRCKI